MTADQVVVAGVAATLEWRNVDQNGAAAEAGTVTVGVTRADGTVLVASGTATTTVTGETGLRQKTLTAAQLADLDTLTATWTDAGDSSAHTTTIAVVGGHLFTLEEARASDAEIADEFDDDAIIEARAEVTEELEWICARAFTPRHARTTLSGTGDRELVIPFDDSGWCHDLLTVEAVAIDGTAMDDDELTELTLAPDRIMYAAEGDAWPFGVGNITIAWTYGRARPPRHLKRAALRRLRHRLHEGQTGIPARAKSFTAVEGGTYELDVADQYRCGVPDIDAVYARYSKRATAGADGTPTPSPTSRPLDLDPQYGSLFHGGRR